MEQINLNRPELWPQPTPFAARTMVMVLGVLVVAVAGLYVYQSYRIDRQRQSLQEAEQLRDRSQKQLEEAQKAHQKRRKELEALRSEVADLRGRVKAFEKAEEALAKRLEAAGGKGALVKALGRARAQQEGVWLTRFLLEGVDPVKLRLEGKTDSPESIPRYLRAVTDQKPYAGGFFRDLNAKAPEGDLASEDVLSFHSEAVFPVSGETGQ